MAPVLIHIMYTDMYTCNSKVSHFNADGTVISGSQGFKAFYDTSVPGTILNCDGDFSHQLVTPTYHNVSRLLIQGLMQTSLLFLTYPFYFCVNKN
jgi:hypothetical protein